MAKRIKTVTAPRTREEADAALLRIGEHQRAISAIEAEATAKIEAIKAEAKARSGNLAGALKEDFGIVKEWADQNRQELLESGKRSVMMTHGQLGWRWGNPAVKIARGVEESDLVVTLQRLELQQLLRTRVELNREAILEEPELVERVPGISVEQVETFWVKPSAVELEQTARSQVLKNVPKIEES